MGSICDITPTEDTILPDLDNSKSPKILKKSNLEKDKGKTKCNNVLHLTKSEENYLSRNQSEIMVRMINLLYYISFFMSSITIVIMDSQVDTIMIVSINLIDPITMFKDKIQ